MCALPRNSLQISAIYFRSSEDERVFSVVKAVKENARDRVGPVPPERVIPDPKQKAAAKPKYKKTLADLLSSGSEGDEV